MGSINDVNLKHIEACALCVTKPGKLTSCMPVHATQLLSTTKIILKISMEIDQMSVCALLPSSFFFHIFLILDQIFSSLALVIGLLDLLSTQTLV
jgi:hypothetical protein